MKRTAIVFATLVAACVAGTASAQQVSLTLRNGRASLHAENATIRQILAEWERQGGVRVVGVDRLVAGQPLTITLADVSERQALDIVLRSVPGYMVVDRADPAKGASRYDRLVLLARTTTPAPAVAAGPAAPAQGQPLTPAADQQALAQAPEVDQADDDAEPPAPTAPVINPYPAGGAAAGAAGNAASNVLNSGGANGNGNVQPETQFDYANPQRYFERMRQLQATQSGQQPSPQPGQPAMTPAPVYPGAATQPPNTPRGTPSATGTLAQPGIAPVPTTPPAAGQGQVFNPYNLPPEQLQGNPTSATPGTPVEPDRAKYANPYVPTPATKPPQ